MLRSGPRIYFSRDPVRSLPMRPADDLRRAIGLVHDPQGNQHGEIERRQLPLVLLELRCNKAFPVRWLHGSCRNHGGRGGRRRRRGEGWGGGGRRRGGGRERGGEKYSHESWSLSMMGRVSLCYSIPRTASRGTGHTCRGATARSATCAPKSRPERSGCSPAGEHVSSAPRGGRARGSREEKRRRPPSCGRSRTCVGETWTMNLFNERHGLHPRRSEITPVAPKSDHKSRVVLL